MLFKRGNRERQPVNNSQQPSSNPGREIVPASSRAIDNRPPYVPQSPQHYEAMGKQNPHALAQSRKNDWRQAWLDQNLPITDRLDAIAFRICENLRAKGQLTAQSFVREYQNEIKQGQQLRFFVHANVDPNLSAMSFVESLKIQVNGQKLTYQALDPYTVNVMTPQGVSLGSVSVKVSSENQFLREVIVTDAGRNTALTGATLVKWMPYEKVRELFWDYLYEKKALSAGIEVSRIEDGSQTVNRIQGSVVSSGRFLRGGGGQ